MVRKSIALGIFSMLISGATADAALFSDNFNGRSGALTGQTATSGQNWTAFSFFGSYGSYTVDPIYGESGTEGAGTQSSAAQFGNSVSFTGVSSGVVRFEADLVTEKPADPASTGASTPIHQFWLLDSVSGQAASLAWYNNNAAANPQQINFEGLGFSDPLHNVGAIVAQGRIHQTLDIDLTNKTVTYGWTGTDKAGTPVSGSVNLGTYSATFAPNVLHLWGRGESNQVGSGWDNINYDIVPEPAGLMLLGLGGVGLLRRRASRA